MTLFFLYVIRFFFLREGKTSRKFRKHTLTLGFHFIVKLQVFGTRWPSGDFSLQKNNHDTSLWLPLWLVNYAFKIVTLSSPNRKHARASLSISKSLSISCQHNQSPQNFKRKKDWKQSYPDIKRKTRTLVSSILPRDREIHLIFLKMETGQ